MTVERSDAAKVAFLHLCDMQAKGHTTIQTVKPVGLRELCDEGLLDEVSREGDTYGFVATELGQLAADYANLMTALDPSEPVSPATVAPALRHILQRLGPPKRPLEYCGFGHWA